MSLGVMASNQRCPRLFSLDETVFMCTNDEDDSDDILKKKILFKCQAIDIVAQPKSKGPGISQSKK